MRAPSDYVLARDICSYGYFLLEPNFWLPAHREFATTIDVDDAAVTFRITQGGRASAKSSFASVRGKPVRVVADAKLDAHQRASARVMLTRMLRLDEDEGTLREFHRLDPRFKKAGRGRLMRSPTFFEDVIKTVTSCNVQWPSTIVMNARLCEVAGRESASGRFAFPTPERLSKMRPANLRARCRVGYRDARIVELARMFHRGEIDQAWFASPTTSDDDVFEALIELPGIGPYAAANIMQLLGRYARLPLDSESVRHGKHILGLKGTNAQIMRRVGQHFEPFGHHRFRSYWFELWDFYERKRGRSWTWDRETTGKTFTASQLSKDLANDLANDLVHVSAKARTS